MHSTLRNGGTNRRTLPSLGYVVFNHFIANMTKCCTYFTLIIIIRSGLEGCVALSNEIGACSEKL